MNSIGNKFILTTFGESHGEAIGGVIDGCPAKVTLDFDAFSIALQRRRTGDAAPLGATTSRQEPDHIEWLSGLMDRVTLGTPIAFAIHNSDFNDDDYLPMKNLCRPGHADFTYKERYGIHDWRGGGRSSARETVARVVAGEIARQCLVQQFSSFSIKANATSRGIVECTLTGIPTGIGNPMFDKLNARLAHAVMSIPSAIGFEIGLGFSGASLNGEHWRDEWNFDGSTKTNHCGGIQGGISNGMPITFRAAFHAPSTTPEVKTSCLPITRDETNTLITITPKGRHDIDPTSRIPIIVESMACITLLDLTLDI